MTICRSLRSQVRRPGGNIGGSVLPKRPARRTVYRRQATVVAVVARVTATRIYIVPKQESDVEVIFALGLGSPTELEGKGLTMNIGDLGVGLPDSFFNKIL
ncbi:hypothetical protein VNI00_015912 [Paramarasmius palmivorus]|uniref:Uncharacterized protein n=1 Tax=Paramarasmius palmivorus TaxID=297713 RepID=A0AAW0BGX0_9AGAR